jgi:aspartate ammonia-lyase
VGRIEKDLLGEVEIPDGALWGPQTERARVNFPVAGRPANPALIRAGAEVKKACALANLELGFLPAAVGAAIVRACDEVAAGGLADQFVTDALQGGAGTSANMNWNEAIAARASQFVGGPVGALEHVNLHQSTNDVFPTALRVAAIRELRALEEAVVTLLEACQDRERAFAGVVKLGRTELRDALPTTLGRSYGAFAAALARDRWRIEKCVERIRETNLGGTAVGTGMGAPTRYIFLVTEKLREVTRLNLARADNLVDATQNLDAFVEVSGILKAHAVNLIKIARDHRLMASGPDGGLGEIELPAVQPGSSIMPGKVNPVMAEMAMQAGFRVLAHDAEVTAAAAGGELELNAFLPLLADALLDSLQILRRADDLFARRCVAGVMARPERCRALMERSRELAAALIPEIGHERAVDLARRMRETGEDLRTAVAGMGLLPAEKLDDLLRPERLCALGWRLPADRGGQERRDASRQRTAGPRSLPADTTA